MSFITFDRAELSRVSLKGQLSSARKCDKRAKSAQLDKVINGALYGLRQRNRLVDSVIFRSLQSFLDVHQLKTLALYLFNVCKYNICSPLNFCLIIQVSRSDNTLTKCML